MTSTSTVAYAVHVDGGLWDDRRISVWCADPQDALARLERAAEFFDGDDPLLTIVRATFTETERHIEPAVGGDAADGEEHDEALP